MMHVRFLSLICCLAMAFPAMTQEDRYGESDPEAEKILDQLSEQYKQYKTIRAEFTLTIHTPDDDVNDELSGTLYLKGDMYKLDMENQAVTCDNKTVWTYLKDAKEVQVNTYEPDDGVIQPTDIFTIYKSGFLAGYEGEEQDNGKTFHVIELTPYDKDKEYHKIRLMIEKDGDVISRARVFDKNGNQYLYAIRSFTPNPGLADAFFQFEEADHPGVEVIDLR